MPPCGSRSTPRACTCSRKTARPSCPRRARTSSRSARPPPDRVAVKLGLLTAAFPELGLEEIARWASAAGFETLEIACWPAGAESERRYAGVSHVDLETLDDAGGRAIVEMLASHGMTISALAYSPALWRQLFEI